MRRISLVVTAVVLVMTLLAGTAGATTLRVAHLYDPMAVSGSANYDWFMGIVRAFEKANPGVKVEMEIFQWDQIDVKAMSDYRAGIKTHDVFLTSPQLMGLHAMVGSLTDLTPYVEQWSEEMLSDFNWSAAWEGGLVGDQILGIPLGAHTRAFAYNRDMFVEVGLDPDKPPTTLEELVEYAKLLTRDVNGDGRIDIYGLGMYFGPSRATIEVSFAPLLWHFGGQLWDPETKHATFASEAGIKAAQFIYDLVHTYKVTPEWAVAGTYDDAVMVAFTNEQTAMAWGWGSYWIGVLEDRGWVNGLFPPTSDGKPITADVALMPTSVRGNFTNCWCASIYSLSENKDLAWEFINFMLDPDALINFPDAGLPARASDWNRPEFSTPFYQTWKDAVMLGSPMPPTAYYGELADTVAAALQEILVNGADIATTLRNAQEEYNAQYAGF